MSGPCTPEKSNGSSLPDAPPDSPGSSVSTRLMDEYEELLKYAVVVPSYDPTKLPKTLTDVRESFPQPERETLITVAREHHQDEDSETTPVVVRVTRETGLPDFGQSPIQVKPSSRCRSEESDSEFAHKPGFDLEDEEEKDTRPIQRDFEVKVQKELNFSDKEEVERDIIYTTGVDRDVNKMENLLDQWCLELKRNVLAEYGQSKIRIVELGRQQLLKEQERHAAEKCRLQDEMEGMKELLHTYEKSIERKDQVISNMMHALQKQKEKHDMLKKFSEWKIKHNDIKRENFAGKLAMKHHERKLTRQVWDAWHSTIENKWRTRVERACQGKAQEVCMQLTNNYESKVKSLNEALEASRQEVSFLHKQREQYEETMKKAFMRGVCALNLEAMTMFQNGEENKNEPVQNSHSPVSDVYSDNLEASLPDKDYSTPKTIPQEAIYTTRPQNEAPPPKVIAAQGSRPSALSSMAQSRATVAGKTSHSKSKVVTARISAKVDTGRPASGLGGHTGSGTLAPPMSSVIVERHQAVTKQTIGQATASKYPLVKSDQQRIVHRRIAGQSGALSVSPNIQTVKVVE